MTRRALIVDDFFDQAAELRAYFDAQHVDRAAIGERRFVWDWWHVPGQYTYLRTPAPKYFPEPLFDAFRQRIASWAAERLGVGRMTVCWLSFYLDGCEQQLHTDVAHGPWAFTYSLTPWEARRFTGGETRLLRGEVLDFWRRGAGAYLKSGVGGSASWDLFEDIEPRWNRLVVFDGRIPHAVNPVRGTRDPLESRVALHGWLAPATITCSGGLSVATVAACVDDAWPALEDRLADFVEADGCLVVRLAIEPDGRVSTTAILSDLLESTADDPAERQRLVDAIVQHLGALRFPPAAAPSTAVVPFEMAR